MNLTKKPGVLIVDDDPLVSEMIRGVLEDLGYYIAGEASNGSEAVELTQRLHPDLILMDIEMPAVNGIEAARQIFQICPTPVVMLTAYETPALVEEASTTGIGAYLIKPPRPRELERAITVTMARFNDMMILRRMNEELEAALARVKTLHGLLPICASCKKIRDDHGYWQQVEVFIRDHSEADFTHGLCPECLIKIYPEFYE